MLQRQIHHLHSWRQSGMHLIQSQQEIPKETPRGVKYALVSLTWMVWLGLRHTRERAMHDALRVREWVYQEYKSHVKHKRQQEDTQSSKRHKRVTQRN